MKQLTQKKKRNLGFTLVEVVAVLVIMVILIVLLVPALTGYIDRARETEYFTQARNAVQAAQTVASERYGSGRFDPSNFLSQNRDEILALAETPSGSSITSITFPTGGSGDSSARIDEMTYQAPDGTPVYYVRNGSPMYSLDDTSSSRRGAGSYVSDWLAYINTISGTSWNTTNIRNAVADGLGENPPGLEAYEKEYLQNAADTLGVTFNSNNTNGLSWVPTQVNAAENGYLLTLSPYSAESPNNIMTTMVYYNGNYYATLEHTSGQNKISNTSIHNNFDLSQLDNAYDVDYYKDHLSEVDGKVWVKLT